LFFADESGVRSDFHAGTTCFQLPTIPDAFEGYFWR
jgi:hypothetical protein